MSNVNDGIRPIRRPNAACVLLISAFAIGLGSACSKDLSRPKAAELISQQQGLPRPQTMTLQPRYLKRSWNRPVVGFGTITLCVHEGEKYADVEARLIDYQARGLLRIGFEADNGACPGIWATVGLTDEGKKHLAAESGGAQIVKMFDLAFGEVTGVQTNEQLKAASAEYTLRIVEPSPFGANLAPDDTLRTATFALFDDGWRIQAAPVQGAMMRFREVSPDAALLETKRVVEAASAAVEHEAQRLQAIAVSNPSVSLPNVSSCQSAVDRFKLSADRIVTDMKTGLQWLVGPDTPTSYVQAERWLSGLSTAGSRWRFPTRAELRTLYQEGLCTQDRDPVFQTKGSWFWAEQQDEKSQWQFGFSFGGREEAGLRNDFSDTGWRVMAVRPASVK